MMTQDQQQMSSTLYCNRLAGATSPYLLQHADNPVFWQPWDELTLDLARELNKPILLSIGYAACHWCHVMAHESFADTTTANLMNQMYVSIKVDREERPDLDKTYQLVHQILTRRAGGWPLTLALDPVSLTPFFAGTYFPPDSRYGIPGFPDVLQQVAAHYHRHKLQWPQHHKTIMKTLKQIEQRPVDNIPDNLPEQCLQQLQQEFDTNFAGFGVAPKFPQPTRLEFCLHVVSSGSKAHNRQLATSLLHKTLTAMANGGLFDQLAGGFFRYSTDDNWQIPHFEKMLYDNAQLLGLYTKAWIGCDDTRYRTVAEQTLHWILADMQNSQGGYYSSLDADSEAVEGQYYVWSKEQIAQIVEPFDRTVLEQHFGLDQPANFEGRWHLYINKTATQIATEQPQSEKTIRQQVTNARRCLLHQRQRRVPPTLDDKVLCSWNSMTCAAMAYAGKHLHRSDAIDSAICSLRFIKRELWENGRLLAVYRGGKSHGAAFLDDYAHTLDAIMNIIGLRWEEGLLEWACELADVVLEHFATGEGDYFFTANDQECVLHRHRPADDDAIPSGNGILAKVLGQLGTLLAEPRYLQVPEQILRATSGVTRQAPSRHCSLVIATMLFHRPLPAIILRGPLSDMDSWLERLGKQYLPSLQLCLLPNEATSIPPQLADKPMSDKIVAYYCEKGHCLPPLHHTTDLISLLRQNQANISP